MPKITHENDGLIFNPVEDVREVLSVHCACSTVFPGQRGWAVFSTVHVVLYSQGYVAGQCSALLKWKPPNLNTVDFKLAIVEVDRQGYVESDLLCVASGNCVGC